jgi:hypothetical protein
MGLFRMWYTPVSNVAQQKAPQITDYRWTTWEMWDKTRVPHRQKAEETEGVPDSKVQLSF